MAGARLARGCERTEVCGTHSGTTAAFTCQVASAVGSDTHPARTPVPDALPEALTAPGRGPAPSPAGAVAPLARRAGEPLTDGPSAHTRGPGTAAGIPRRLPEETPFREAGDRGCHPGVGGGKRPPGAHILEACVLKTSLPPLRQLLQGQLGRVVTTEVLTKGHRSRLPSPASQRPPCLHFQP